MSEENHADIKFRRAEEAGLAAIIALLAEGSLAKGRDDSTLPLDAAYEEAFKAIERDNNNFLLVGVQDKNAIACLQISVIPGLTYRGGWRAQIEGVRVATSMRGKGIGRALLTEALHIARKRGCGLVQLMAHKQRHDAHRFYESLGFARQHEGFRLKL
jgi:ribosomal protein S18 acetylase RimI-like enzyme